MKPDADGSLAVEANVLEVAKVKADFGGSGVTPVEDVDDSLGLGVRPKGNCVDPESEGGTNGGNVKPPVFVPLSLAEGSFGNGSANPMGGFGMENSVFLSGGALAPKMGPEAVGAGPWVVGGCGEPSKSD